MKKKEENFYRGTSKECLIAMGYYPNFIKMINPENKPYEKLHQWLLENEKGFDDNNWSLPSLKELSKILSIDNGKIARYINMLYNDIFLLNTQEPEKFKKDGQILCDLSFKYVYDNYSYFTLGLDYVPRIGEIFDFYFINPIMGCSSYYVKDVSHYYYSNGHTIRIKLLYGHPNQYLQLLREKAYLKRYISFHDYYSEHGYLLEEKLIKMFENL